MLKSLLITSVLLSSIQFVLGTFAIAGNDEKFCEANHIGLSATIKDPYTIACFEAYSKLPCSMRLGRIPKSQFAKHTKKYKSLYTAYNNACFMRFETLRNPTKEILRSVAGALFIQRRGKLEFLCSAFRVSAHRILTAGHCISGKGSSIDLTRLIFRLIGQNNDDLAVIRLAEIRPEISNVLGPPESDFDDFAVLEISESNIKLPLNDVIFDSSIAFLSRILVFGFNKFYFDVILNGDAERWAEAMQYSRVEGAQRFPLLDLDQSPPSELAAQNCIYHNSPTYFGMSGAIILGMRGSKTSEDKRERYVAGMHLRNGAASDEGQIIRGCGDYPSLNIGILLPHVALKVDP